MNLGHKSAPASLLALLLAAPPLLGAASRTGNTQRNRTHHALSSTTHRRRRSSSLTSKSARTSRRPNAYQRLAKMQMDPGRVESIQRALSDAGVYHGSPTGQWDSETRDAMARYQAQNGFGVTGLPDAKSLMKLGLGPHPLPAELDKKRASNIQPNPPAVASGSQPDSAAAGGASSAPNAPAVPAGKDAPRSQDPPQR